MEPFFIAILPFVRVRHKKQKVEDYVRFCKAFPRLTPEQRGRVARERTGSWASDPKNRAELGRLIREGFARKKNRILYKKLIREGYKRKEPE